MHGLNISFMNKILCPQTNNTGLGMIALLIRR